MNSIELCSYDSFDGISIKLLGFEEISNELFSFEKISIELLALRR